MSFAERFACIHKKIGVAVADAGVAHAEAFEPQIVNHAACRHTWRIFEDATGALLPKRLAGAALFVADTNSF